MKSDIQTFLEDPRRFGMNKLPARAASWPSSRPDIPDDTFLYDIEDWRTDTEPARIGVALRLKSPDIVRVRWYGRGPHECYCDRKHSAFVGWYSADPDTLATSYTRPQENGQRCDVRFLDLEAADGTLTRIRSPRLFGFTLRRCSIAALAAARHADAVPDEGFWELILDAAQRGVGGDDSWGADVLPAYRLSPGSGTATFSFKPAPHTISMQSP